MEIVVIVLGLFVAALIVFVISGLSKSGKAESRATQAETLLAERERVVADLTKRLDAANYYLNEAEKEAATLRERIAVTEQSREAMEKAAEDNFRNVANEIFRTQSREFKDSSEKRMAELLNPLKENIEGFRKMVADSYQNEARERFSLQKEVRNLIETNRSLGQEAQELSRALKGDSKAQGDWGEMILERLLENSGLKKDVHFETQVTTNSDGSKIVGENGQKLRPDVVVKFPDDRCVVIDSKVSLTAYIDYVNAPEGSSEAKSAAQRHVCSVKSHVNELLTKQYHKLVGQKQLDFTMMFIPNEGAYFAMMKEDPGLWEWAYTKNVLITSPTHLISILKMLEQLWKQDAINKNVQEIGRLSGRMLDKLASFQQKFDAAETSLTTALASFGEARKYLFTGQANVYKTAQEVLTLGAKTSKPDAISRYASQADDTPAPAQLEAGAPTPQA